MASAQPEKSSVLQDELTCSVCLHLYRDPHLLPCGHNFCMTCLRRLKRQAERGRFRCPECRETHRCSVNLQKNFKLANIAEDYQARRGQVTAAAGAASSGALLPSWAPQPGRNLASVPCDYCPPAATEASGGGPAEGGGSAASASGERSQPPTLAFMTCLKCEVSMCQEHVKPHLELVAFREHPLTEPVDDLRKRKCPDHDEMFRYYCMDDKVCVCNACTIEGGHTGHTLKTLKNTMKDLKGTLNKQLHRVERKYSMAEKKLQEQKEKESHNKKFLEDSEQSMTKLSDEVKAMVDGFISRLRECTQEHCGTNGPAIQNNISRIGQDKARLQEVRCGIEGLMQENDPFRFIEGYKTRGKQLRKTMFYPEHIDMETDTLGSTMEEKTREFLTGELHTHINGAIESLCPIVDPDEEEQEDDEEEATEEEDDDEDDLYSNSSEEEEQEEEMRSEGEEGEEEEEEEEEEEDDDGHDQSESADDVYSPEAEEEEEEEDEEGEEEEEVL